jgi:hypothetical protein
MIADWSSMGVRSFDLGCYGNFEKDHREWMKIGVYCGSTTSWAIESSQTIHPTPVSPYETEEN